LASSRVRCVFRRDSGSLTFDVPPSEISRWRAVARVLRSPLDAVGCTIFPAFCSLCGSLLPHLSSAPICSACWMEISVSGEPACTRCGDTLDTPCAQPAAASGKQAPSLCRACRLAPPPFVKAVAYGPYQGKMRELIHAFKYDGLRSVAPRLGELLARAITRLAAKAPSELLVVSVPLHRSKHADRGFNQARLLACEAVAYLRKHPTALRLSLAPSTLMRLRATESQAGLTPRQRRLNVRGAFGVSDPAAVFGKHVLLIDDILTTGATARAAARALLQAGAESVWVATLARARRTGFASERFSALTEDRAGEFQVDARPTGNDALAVPLQHAIMNSENQPSI
jgi:ComF family protein